MSHPVAQSEKLGLGFREFQRPKGSDGSVLGLQAEYSSIRSEPSPQDLAVGSRPFGPWCLEIAGDWGVVTGRGCVPRPRGSAAEMSVGWRWFLLCQWASAISLCAPGGADWTERRSGLDP